LNKQKLEIEQCDQAIEEGVRNQKIIFFSVSVCCFVTCS
jgi:hypothetical protein